MFINKKKISYNMHWIIILLISVQYAKFAMGEIDYFPGLRRPPSSVQNWLPSNTDESNYLMAQLSNIIEEHARRRFQQQLQQQQHQHQHSRGPSMPSEQDVDGSPSFTYQFPASTKADINDPIPFAVNPLDPRYYSTNTGSSSSTDKNDDYADITEKEDELPIKTNADDGVPYYKLKAPMNVNPKINDEISTKFLDSASSKSRDVMSREDVNGLVEKLLQARHENMMLNKNNLNNVNKEHHIQRAGDVVQKPMDIDTAMGMYVVALVAGVSAAITVGLIALGIGWYTLSKKAKAAADVEYPAYGVTGPNKDISPSGDRRLAQSAQMYHYQHQKQQIIAMENRSNGERNGSISEVESDDENEEGDYTVYECPGLAPTGEMEVKNPLFLDDPTPATPAQQQQQQQQASQPNQVISKVTPPTVNITNANNQSIDKKM